MKKRDLIWKGIIREFFPYFIQFFFQNWEEEIDLSRGYEFLDKELEQILPEAEAKGRRADILVKVFSPAGEEFWFLIHVEVQGYTDDSFAKRMYAIQYRLFDRFEKPVGALAIYTDEDPGFHPKSFSFRCLGKELKYPFHTYKVLENPPEKLEKFKPNPFALIMEAAWYGLNHRKKTDSEILKHKESLARKLLREGYPKETVRGLLDFIKYYTPFDDQKYYLTFDKKIRPMKEIPNTLRETILLDAKEEGIAIGVAKGKKEGKKEGKAEGKKEGKAEGKLEGIELTLAIIKLLKKKVSIKEIAKKMKIRTAVVLKIKKQLEAVN
ncbi:MAG TPA: hypothetical protein ENJ95_10605 [Bacteroidetes bacterium]|nr:hypothetical protein [Bacteroidota bacterium]